jgi:hypothetical protein
MHLQRAAGNAAVGALVQRSADEEAPAQSPVKNVVGKGGGSALDSGVQQKMESSLGYDFSGVRVHTGGEATAAAKSVQAQAFTVGNDVVFNEGKYNPSSSDGQRTIAHELTHVVQQSQGNVPGTSVGGGVKVSDPGDWAEQQAESTADAVMSSDSHAGHDHGGGAGGGASVQTLPLQRAAGPEDEVQELAEPNVQRAAGPEDEVQELAEPNVQRASGPEDEVQELAEPNVQRAEAGAEEAAEDEGKTAQGMFEPNVQREGDDEPKDE